MPLLLSLFLITVLDDAPAGWHRYRSPDKKISVAFPKKPGELVQYKNLPEGEIKFTTIANIHSKDDPVGYFLTWSDFKEPKKNNKAIEVSLDGTEDGIIDSRKGEVLTSKSIKYGDILGRDFTFKTKSEYFRIQVYITKDRHMMLMFRALSEDALTSQYANDFLGSFELKK